MKNSLITTILIERSIIIRLLFERYVVENRIMYREMSIEMTDKEVKKCMAMLVEDSIILKIKRDIVQNAIDIKFKVRGDCRKKKYRISLLPDTIEDLSEGIKLKVNGEYLYQQFMIAKGYSDYWKDNIFID